MEAEKPCHDHPGQTVFHTIGELEKLGISLKIEARKKILPQAYTRYPEDKI
jgi:hypothetical protein